MNFDDSPSSCTAARLSVTPLPSPVIASMSASTAFDRLKMAPKAVCVGIPSRAEPSSGPAGARVTGYICRNRCK